jgi:hypothetical protein
MAMLLALLATMIVLVLEAVPATFVATQAWDYRPARLFVPLTASLAILNITAVLLFGATDPATIYVLLTVSTLTLAGLCAIMTLFFAALFVPDWWEGARALRWIMLPYILAFVVLAVELIGRLGWRSACCSWRCCLRRQSACWPAGSSFRAGSAGCCRHCCWARWPTQCCAHGCSCRRARRWIWRSRR